MLRGVYTSASGMLVEALKTDVVSNNLANAATRGFKRQSISVRSFPEMLIHRIHDPIIVGGRRVDPKPVVGFLGTGAAIDELGLEMTPGAVTFTGRPLDVAVDGPGFLAVETADGGVAFTRDGRLNVSADGFLTTSSGLRVLGESGPIFVGEGDVTISEDGGVWSDGERIGGVTLWEFAEPGALERLGANLLRPAAGSGAPAPATRSRIRSGYVEDANVNVVREMVDLIQIERAYEANQRMLQVQDETLGRLINEAASLA